MLKKLALIAFAAVTIETTNIYPATMRITEIDGSVLTVETATGIAYQYETDCSDYNVNDLVSVIMHRNRTPETVLDDIILDMNYSGYFIE